MNFKRNDAGSYVCPMGRNGTTDKMCVGDNCAVFIATSYLTADGTEKKNPTEGTCGLGKNV